MPRSLLNIIPAFWAALLALLASASAPAALGVVPDPLVPGWAIIRTAPGASIGQFLDAFNAAYKNQQVSASLAEAIPARPIFLVQLALPDDFSPVQLHALETDLNFNPAWNPVRVYAELLYQGQAPESNSGSTWVGSISPHGAFESQYLLSQVGFDSAHVQSLGSGVVVAVLDTGLDAAHPILAGHIAPGAFNFISNTPFVADLGNGLDDDQDGAIDEGAGHGTFVSGLVALTAPGARILPITVLDSDGVGNAWLFTKGLFYAIDRGVEVINLSIASTYDSRAVADAIDEARCHGIVTVAAAGNFNASEPRQYPAMLDDPGLQCLDPAEFLALGVAALDSNDVKASFSNFHQNLFICAPASSSLAAPGIPDWNLSVISSLPGGAMAAWEGTSMAVPLVCGAVALIRAQHPLWQPQFSTWQSVKQLLADTAVDIYPQNPLFQPDLELGVGRIDVAAAVASAPPAPPLGDLNADGVIAIDDILAVLIQWGLVHSNADISGNGIVDVDDLTYIILNWD